MPAILEFRVRADRPFRPSTRQLHGLACTVFEGSCSSEHSGHDKPFTVWPATPADGPDGKEWQLRMAWTRPGLSPSVLAACGQLRLGPVVCALTDVVVRPATHAALAMEPTAGVTVTFRSPTYFSQNGTDHVLPDPRLIVGSWRKSWNVSVPGGSGLDIGDDVWRELSHAIRLAAFDLQTRRMDSGYGHDRTGFTGTAVIKLARNSPAAQQAIFGTLARFAEFSGTGAQTTHGFGATTVTARTSRI